MMQNVGNEKLRLLTLENCAKETPLDLAIKHGHTELAEYLKIQIQDNIDN